VLVSWLAAIAIAISSNGGMALAQDSSKDAKADQSSFGLSFKKQIQPLLNKFCLRCHNPDKMTSGIRVDHLNGAFEDKQLFLWKDVLKQVASGVMPPEDEVQPTAEQRKTLADWIRRGMIAAKSRNPQKNGSLRRLTVAQYRNTMRDLLGLDDDLTDILPPDGVSKDGFLNNEKTLLLSPLLIESYFDIAERALDLCIVDEDSKPIVQNFRMDLGESINPKPFSERLILGANSLLLNNSDFAVTELQPEKPFDYQPFAMRTKYEFIEGYQGNATVRGWKKYDSIYHSVFACMRGNPGYPKGLPYQTVPQGLLLRPAIPSAELFQVESTYGPKANFKISLRELPNHGRFRVKVKAARYADGLMLERGEQPQPEKTPGAFSFTNVLTPQEINVPAAGIYQADVYSQSAGDSIAPDASKLKDKLVGLWSLDGDTSTTPKNEKLTGKLVGDAKFVPSPFGNAISFDGKSGFVVVDRDDSMNVGVGDFSVSAWIRPRGLRQAGFVCLGRYNYTHGWYFDMPNNQGVLRIETMNPGNQPNGTVQSAPGVIRDNVWQHVAAVVRRGKNKTRLYVNGYEVAVGTVKPTNLDNPTTKLHIGRIEGANLFKGEIDNVRIYRRALDVAEINALVEPGKQFAFRPPTAKGKNLTLKLGDRQFTGKLTQPAFLAVRLPKGPLKMAAQTDAGIPNRIVFTPLKDQDVAKRFQKFESLSPRLGVHVGLRRDCGSTLSQVGEIQSVSNDQIREYVFEGAIANFPSPDVEKNNVNYLAGVREIGVRSEYTDGRDMPRLLVRSVEFEGPYYESWPPRTHRDIFVDSKNKNDPAAYARDIIRSFATRAFRRPISKNEEDSIFAIWKTSYADNADFNQSIKDALLIVLTSPQFLFLIEISESPEPESINDFELASKLSYFLWNTVPDDRLLKLAATNTLRSSLDLEIERMIQDTRFEQFTTEFATQWLNLDKFDVVQTERTRYPRLTRDTKTQLRIEPVRYLQYVMQKNLPLRNLIQSDFIVANEVVADYYDLGDKSHSGFEFVRIAHQSKNLGGLLSQAAILAGLSNGRESNPVKRGAWLARKIIAEPPDDPPPNVPALPENDDKNLTLRQKLEQHRDQDGCAKCHRGIDPWGIPFEQFDAGGLFKKTPVAADSTLPDETEIADFAGLRAYLANDRIDQVAFSFSKHLAIYAIGRSLTYNEIEFLKEKGVELKANGYKMQDMIRFVITSKLFLEK
jgi:hypothetical protein